MGDCIYRNHVAPRTKLYFPKHDFRDPWITWMSRAKRKLALTYFVRQPSMIIGKFIDGDKSLSDAWIGVTRFELLNKNPPSGHMWVQLQDLDISSGKNGQECRKTLSAKPWRNGQKKNPNWTQRESNEAFIPNDVPGYEEVGNNATRKLETSRAPTMPRTVTKPANPNGSSWEMQVMDLKLKRKDWVLHAQSKIMRAESLNRTGFELLRVRNTLIRTTSRTEVAFPCHDKWWGKGCSR